MKAVSVLVLIALAWSATGCGQKGALVLPDAEHPRKKVKLPATPKSRAPAQPTVPAQPGEPDVPAAPATAPSAPAGPAQDAAPPAAVPGSNPTSDSSSPR